MKRGPQMVKGDTERQVVIRPPQFETGEFKLEGTAPLVVHRFANKAKMMEAQAAGQQARSKRTREPKDFDATFKAACHVSEEGWYGINAAGFRLALIDACRLCGFKMTIAKCSIFVISDGIGTDGTPLVRIDGPAPERFDAPARNDNGSIDIRSRPMWRKWGVHLKLRWDASQFSVVDEATRLG